MENITLNPTKEDCRLYEITILLPANLSDKEKSVTMKSVEALFAEKDVIVHAKDEWKRMGLAYKIKGHEEGLFVIFYTEIHPMHITDIEHTLKIERGVLRHLVIKLPDGYTTTDWAKHFADWKAEEQEEKEKRAKEREEKMKERIVQRTARKSTKAREDAKKDDGPVAAQEEISKVELSEKLGEIMSDEDLNL